MCNLYGLVNVFPSKGIYIHMDFISNAVTLWFFTCCAIWFLYIKRLCIVISCTNLYSYTGFLAKFVRRKMAWNKLYLISSPYSQKVANSTKRLPICTFYKTRGAREAMQKNTNYWFLSLSFIGCGLHSYWTSDAVIHWFRFAISVPLIHLTVWEIYH